MSFHFCASSTRCANSAGVNAVSGPVWHQPFRASVIFTTVKEIPQRSLREFPNTHESPDTTSGIGGRPAFQTPKRAVLVARPAGSRSLDSPRAPPPGVKSGEHPIQWFQTFTDCFSERHVFCPILVPSRPAHGGHPVDRSRSRTGLARFDRDGLSALHPRRAAPRSGVECDPRCSGRPRSLCCQLPPREPVGTWADGAAPFVAIRSWNPFLT